MIVKDQLTLLRMLLGEPADLAEARLNPDQLLVLLNLGRDWLCEEALCVQLEDAQTTTKGNSQYSVEQDIIDLYTVEYDGVPLDLVQPKDWRQRIGVDDTLEGPPTCAKFWARQIQVFPVPSDGKLLRIEGWMYAAELTDTDGGDLDFNRQMARTSIYRAAWIGKDLDERDSKDEEKHATQGMLKIKALNRPKGPRMVRKRSNSGMNKIQWLLRS